MNTIDVMKLKAIMEQAQVFASAWALVGSRFDNGNMMDEAEVAKNELHQMIADALEQAIKQEEQQPVPVKTYSGGKAWPVQTLAKGEHSG